MSEDDNGHDTDQSELGRDQRDTTPPKTLEGQIAELQAALGESNALFILARDASGRSAELCAELLNRLRQDEMRNADVAQRVCRIERHLGLAAE